MKLIGSLIILAFILSCQTAPEPAAPVVVEPAPLPAPPPADPPPVTVVAEEPEEIFEPENVSEELYISTMEQVQALIEQLNGIIRARNYPAWVEHLSQDYYRMINSAAFLNERTEELYRRDQMVATSTGRVAQRRVLRSSRDYFDHVVVPARSNDRVDDISFITESQVRAFTVDGRGNVLILYDLEIIDGNWRIVN